MYKPSAGFHRLGILIGFTGVASWITYVGIASNGFSTVQPAGWPAIPVISLIIFIGIYLTVVGIHWVQSGFKSDSANSFGPDNCSPLSSNVVRAPTSALLITTPNPASSEDEVLVPVEVVRVSRGFSFTVIVWVTGIILFINGLIVTGAYDSMQTHPGSGSLTSKPGGIDMLLGGLLIFWRSNRTIYLSWAFWRAALGFIVMPILGLAGFFRMTGSGMIGYCMACVGLMTLTYSIKSLEDRLSAARFWSGTGLVLFGWIVGLA